jgi:hypothetical protein
MQRAVELEHTIDPGFVHHRKIQTILTHKGMEVIDKLISALPGGLPDWQKAVRIDHVYTRVFLAWCRAAGIKPLGEILATKQGRMFCSTEILGPCEDVFETARATSTLMNRDDLSEKVEFQYSTNHITSDTLKSRLRTGGWPISMVAELCSYKDGTAVFEPIIMGFPWLACACEDPGFDIMWYGSTFFENFVEDFDEFARVKDVPIPENVGPMRRVSEKAFKECLRELLGDSTTTDWGGENSDYYSAHLHLNGVRKTAAFLLKGPAVFSPMNLRHLGKNNDQIVRLSHEPAQVLIVQHCHDILPPVRETLRAFAVQPSNPRRYCLMDGRDSLRLLNAYGLYEKAVALSTDEGA